MKFIILAGGSGTRLWPLSRTHRPKQFTRLMGEVTMYEETIHRILDRWTRNNLYVSTNEKFAQLIQSLSSDISPDHFIIEPARRDTGPAMGYVAALLELTDPDEPIAFVPSDHHIQDVATFQTMFTVAEKLIQEKSVLVDVGVTPTFPNIHLGYIRTGNQVAKEKGIELYEFSGFKEKPDLETAESYLKQGNYLWHANYYMWTPRKFMEAYEKHSPTHGKHLRAIQAAHQKGDTKVVEEHFLAMEKISIDYAIAEKLDPGTMWIAKGDFGWSDLGSWDMLYEELKHEQDSSKNLIRGHWQGIDTSGTVVYGNGNKLVATIGVENLVIVDTDDALLVCDRARAQEVKKVVEELEKAGEKEV